MVYYKKFRNGHRTTINEAIKKFKLNPIQPLDLSKCHSFSDLLKGYSNTSFGARKVGEAADVLHNMVSDKDCFVVGTFSGAMTIAKMGLVICDMIDQGMLDAVVTTGALMAHGFVEANGKLHFKYNANMDDKTLCNLAFDRVYDTLELEKNLDDIELIINKVLTQQNPDEKMSSQTFCRELGRYLSKHSDKRGILKSAFDKKIPIYIPAFTDSELGLDFGLFNRLQQMNNKPPLSFDSFLDLEHFTSLIQKQKTLGIFTIGGGVPRNWAQQVGPYLDLIRYRVLYRGNKEKYFSKGETDNMYVKQYKYGVRICPEPVHYGGLSGCTYSEGVSWGKFVPESEGGQFAEVLSDATIAWPLIVKAVLERMGKK